MDFKFTTILPSSPSLLAVNTTSTTGYNTTTEDPDSDLSSFEKFCGHSQFWDTDLLIDSPYPKFTKCFREVALAWIPCMLYLVTCGPYLHYLSKMTSVPVRISGVVVAKTICSICLIGITVATIIVRAVDDRDDTPDALYVSEGCKLACFILTLFVSHLERRKGLVTSALNWIFWFVLFIAGIVPFYSNFKEDTRHDDKFGFIIFYFYDAFICLSMVIASFVEPRSEEYLDLSKSSSMFRHPSPEPTVSFPNRLSFWWMTTLVILGFKRTLEESDIYDLEPADRNTNLMSRFLVSWHKEKTKVEKYNSKVVVPKTSVYHERNKDKWATEFDENTPLIATVSKAKSDQGESPKREKSPYQQISVMKVLLSDHGVMLFSALMAKTCFDLLMFATPKITEALLDYITYRDQYHEWRGYALAASYLALNSLTSVGGNQAIFYTKRAGMRMKATLINAVYRKSLTAASIGDETSKGEVVNLMSVDCQRIEDLAQYINFVFSAPGQIVLALILLYEQLGVAMFAGIGVLFAIIPLNGLIGYFFQKWQKRQMKFKDDRIKLLSEVLNGIKVLKLYAWEGSFQEKIGAIRNIELRIIRNISMLIAILMYVFISLPNMIQVVSYAVHIADKGYLNPTVAFVSLQLFNMLNGPLTILPLFIPIVIQCIVSIQRISDYLSKPDIKTDVVQVDRNAKNAISVENGNFTWTLEQPISTLRNINLAIKPGSLVAVVGTVGCGKSSLISAMLGEMERLGGRVTLKGSIAYVPQEAWIQNATLRDNIIFGKDYRKRKYDQIIDACALKSDIDILPGGDTTEIGEKGINISGGQKQRVSLARAVYSDQDIYLLDDPLSAVDSHVGKHIFHEVIGEKGVLKHKTRLLVTHGIQWLPMVDNIFVVSNGEISESGTYTELLQKDGHFAQFIKEYAQENKDDSAEDEPIPHTQHHDSAFSGDSSDFGTTSSLKRRRLSFARQPSTGNTSRKRSVWDGSSLLEKSLEASKAAARIGTKLTEDEVGLSGKTKLYPQGVLWPAPCPAVLNTELENFGSGRTGKQVICLLCSYLEWHKERHMLGVPWFLAITILTVALMVKIDIYLNYLRQLGVATCAGAFFLYGCWAGCACFAGIWLTEWTGDSYLLNRSNKDTDKYDDKTGKYLGVYAAASVSQGLFILVFSIIAAYRMTYAAGVLHTNMLQNVLRSPMSFFDTTPIGRIMNRFSRDVEVLDNILPLSMKQIMNVAGLVVITIVNISYGTPLFLVALLPLSIIYISIQLVYVPSCRQLRRINSITRSPIYVHFSETLSGASSIRAYGVKERFIQESMKRIDHNVKFYFASVAAASWLSFRLQLLGNLVIFAAAIFAVAASDIDPSVVGLSVSYASSMTNALEQLVSVISETETNIVSVERLQEYTNSPQESAWILEHHRPKPDWPEKGNVVFDNYQTRYRPGLDLVLRDLTCTIKGGEKIGIVGRTGAGKSSMTVALFRIIEAAGGKIIIDGEDVFEMGLHDLRNKITILPQEPVIFSGTLRMNLDPFNKYTEPDMWNALEHSYLKEFVQGLPGKLDYECGEEGSNLSVGQRQLVCLARTLLRKTKILVLDEATAAVDMETDDLIQETIRTQFKECTVLTIAHRLNTIIDYDRVMVLDKGYIKEFDSPQALLADENSIFHGMAKDAGIV